MTTNELHAIDAYKWMNLDALRAERDLLEAVFEDAKIESDDYATRHKLVYLHITIRTHEEAIECERKKIAEIETSLTAPSAPDGPEAGPTGTAFARLPFDEQLKLLVADGVDEKFARRMLDGYRSNPDGEIFAQPQPSPAPPLGSETPLQALKASTLKDVSAAAKPARLSKAQRQTLEEIRDGTFAFGRGKSVVLDKLRREGLWDWSGSGALDRILTDAGRAALARR